MKKDSLTKLQRAFVDEYLKSPDLNGAECVRRAGYRTKYPNKIATQLLGNARLLGEIEKARRKREERTEVTQDMVLKELALLGFSDLTDLVEIEEGGLIVVKKFDDIPKGKTRTLKAIKEDRIIRETADGKQMVVHDKIRYEVWDKPKALELLGKHLGMFIDVKHGGEIKLKHELSITDLKKSLEEYVKSGD